MVKGKSEESLIMNDYLTQLRNKIYQKENELMEKGFIWFSQNPIHKESLFLLKQALYYNQRDYYENSFHTITSCLWDMFSSN